MTTCPIDGVPLVRPPTGRPPTFCGVACRRVAEHELRRLDRRLAGLEEERDRVEMTIASETYKPAVPGLVKRRDAISTAITTATDRQRLLFARLTPEGDTDDDR